MNTLNRRQWLRRGSIASALALVGGPTAIARPATSYAPRPLLPDQPVRLSSNENPYGPSPKVRIGYLVARPDIATRLKEKVVAFTNTPALFAARTALQDQEFYDFSIEKNREAKKRIYATLDRLGLEYVPSQTNFIFFKTGESISGFGEKMMQAGVQVGRPFPPYLDWCRISTGSLEEVDAFNNALEKVMS